MAKDSPNSATDQTPFLKFQALVRRIVRVSKAEADNANRYEESRKQPST